jgi:hypothetical protein
MELHRTSHARSQRIWTTETTELRRSRALKASSAGRHRRRRFRAQSPAVHSAKIMDFERGSRRYSAQSGRAAPPPFSAVAGGGLPWGGQRRGLGTEKTLGWSVDLVERPKKPAPKELLMSWAREWAKEGVAVDWQKLLPPEGFQVLPRRWVVERTFSWIEKNRRMSLGTTRGYLRAANRSYVLP